MMKYSLTTLLIGLLLNLLQIPAFGARTDAVVKIVCTTANGSQRSGSGVCIDETGIILTAAHVVRNGTCRVHFNQDSYPAIPALVPAKEGVAILKINAHRELPFLEVAEIQLETEDPVWVMGYPQGKWNSFQTHVTSTRLFFTEDSSTQLIGVFDPIIFGTSGGPLVTNNWKVAGIASVSGKIPQAILEKNMQNETAHISGTALDRTGGMFLALRHIKEAYQTFQATNSKNTISFQKKPVLYAFTSAQCSACRQFKHDFHAGEYASFDVRLIEYDSPEWHSTVTEAQQTTAKQIPDSIPFFWIKGSREFVQQPRYHAPGLLQRLIDIVQTLGRMIHNPPEKFPDRFKFPKLNEVQSERPLSTPTPGIQPSNIDWSGIQVIVLATKQDVGVLRGQIRKQALSAAVGPLRRKLAEATDGRINFNVVAERLTPFKYDAVVQAAEVSPDPATIIVLVPKQSVGLVKGMIAKKIEKALTGKLKAAPIDLVFERIHPEDYASIQAALRTEEETNTNNDDATQHTEAPQPTDEDPLSPRNTIPTLAVAWLAERITTRLKRRMTT